MHANLGPKDYYNFATRIGQLRLHRVANQSRSVFGLLLNFIEACWIKKRANLNSED